MAFISLIFTASKLKKLQNQLIEEKLDAIKISQNEKPKGKFRFRHIGVDIRVGIKKFLKKIFRCPEKSCMHRTCYKLQHEGSCENYTIKSVFGFFGGIILTYILYIFFIFQLNLKLTTATVVCSMLGCVLTVGLAFSSIVRCIVLLSLPQFFSKRGRQALLAYAFVLALTGPAQNTLNNMGILSESLACGQEQLKQAVRQIIDVIKKPFLAIRDAIKQVVKTVKEIIKKIKEILLKIKRVIMAIVRVIKAAFEFLGKIINICNKELGTPFERCTRVFENAIADCNAKLGPLFNWLCSLTYIVKAVCYIVKIFDYVCMLVDFISDSVIGVVIRKIKIFIRHIKTMFYVRIKFSHSFKFETTSSKKITEIAKEIVQEIKHRSRFVVAFFNFMTSAAMLFFLYIVFQVSYYRIMFLTSERFDNIYITKYFRDIDLRRAKYGKETVLPLNKKEESIYVPISSGKLAKTERRKLAKSAVALGTASLKLGTHILADYCLYWILTLITYHGRYQSKVQAPSLPVAHVSGEGFVAKLLRAIVNAFQPVGIQLEIDTVPCLPIPIPPDYDRYVQIGVTLLLCWILTLLEPYGLRFRNYIMAYYHPVRAKQRTIWLYNHILRARSSFLTFARRQLRRKFGQKGIDNVSCKEHLRATLRCKIFRICLGEDLQTACLLCGEVFRESDNKKFIKCHTPGCPGFFCQECFADLENICPICLSPIEYGDLDDLDEEKDSSGDEPPRKLKKKRKCPWFPCGKAEDDDKEPLLDEEKDEPKEQEEPSDSSTDYSDSYQYDKVQKQPFPQTVPFKDVEKQDIPDYASMDSFRDEEEERVIEIDINNQIKVKQGETALIDLDIATQITDQEEDLDYENNDETLPLINPSPCQCFDSDKEVSPRRVEFIGVPNKPDTGHRKIRRKVNIIPSPNSCCVCSDLELLEHFEDTSFMTLPKSTMSTSTRSDCKYCHAPDIDQRSTLTVGTTTEEELCNIVPKLDLSFLERRDKASSSERKQFTDRFSNVTYEEVCESYPSTNRTMESSSLLSSLQNSPSDVDEGSKLRKRNVRTQYRVTHEVDSPSSMDSFEFDKTQRRKVKKYYEAANKLCSDERCEYSGKRNTIKNMFRRLLPKRRRNQDQLPLHRFETDESVELRSYNYSQENWDTLSVDTDSPTYPFDTQRSSGTSEEERHLLGNSRRVRGGECTHLINCRLIGRTCDQLKVRSFDAKSRTRLKDFSSLSLPPKPKPKDTKELLFRYFLSIEDLTPTKDPGFQMIPLEIQKGVSFANPSGIPEKDISEYTKIRSKIPSTETLGEIITSGSSDSGLSEGTCQALFGGPCPGGGDLETQLEDQKELDKEKNDIEESLDKENSGTTVDANEEQEIKIKENSEKTQQLSDEKDLNNQQTELRERKSTEFKSFEESSQHQVSRQPSKRKSAQLNQLLYKDDKTEISLVQKLSPEKSVSRPEDLLEQRINPSHQLSRKHPSVKLQISLHNSIVTEDVGEDLQEETTEDIKMNSPKSKDKIVETKETFPLRQEWHHSDSSRSGKIILASDKTQQTSDNDFYHSSNNTVCQSTDRRSSSVVASRTTVTSVPKVISSSHPRFSSSDPNYDSSDRYYSYEKPEKDLSSQSCCKCQQSTISPREQISTGYTTTNEEPGYTCCRCANLIPRETRIEREYRAPTPPLYDRASPVRTRERNTHFSNFGKVPSEVNFPEMFPPPPPRPPIPRTSRRRSPPKERTHKSAPFNEQGHNQCQCYLRQRAVKPFIYSGDYDMQKSLPQAPSYPEPRHPQAPRYPEPRQHLPTHRCYGDYEPTSTSYSEGPEDAEYDYLNLNPNSSLTDLPYQNNEEYLELVQELQDTLHSRNRNRVRRAMQEFENRSKHNKPLERPIIDYDETSESEEPIIRKLTELRTDKMMCCAEEKCSCKQKEDAYLRSGQRKKPPRRDNLSSEGPSHWTMDPNSGEWFKSCRCAKVPYKGTKSCKVHGEQKQCPCNCEHARYK